jgi:hypothetical protein
MPFSVYVISLCDTVLQVRKFAKANPEHIPTKPCVYVGSTAKTPEQRYADQLTKKTGNKLVKEFHDGLHSKLTEKQPKYATRSAAEFEEFVLAKRLRRKGYAVWTNWPKVPPFYKETHFSADSWDDAPAQFAIITAYATTGETWPEAVNIDADCRLRSTLRGRNLWAKRVTGHSSSSGHREPGWAAALDHNSACDIGKWFKQDAIYYISDGKIFVSYCDARRALIPIGRFAERLHLTQ